MRLQKIAKFILINIYIRPFDKLKYRNRTLFLNYCKSIICFLISSFNPSSIDQGIKLQVASFFLGLLIDSGLLIWMQTCFLLTAFGSSKGSVSKFSLGFKELESSIPKRNLNNLNEILGKYALTLHVQ